MNSPSKNAGMDCHSFLQGISLTQRLNPGLLHCRQILYHLSHQGIKRNPRQRAILKTWSLNLSTNQYLLQKSSVSTNLELNFRNHLVKMCIRWLGNLSQLTVIVSKKILFIQYHGVYIWDAKTGLDIGLYLPVDDIFTTKLQTGSLQHKPLKKISCIFHCLIKSLMRNFYCHTFSYFWALANTFLTAR